MQYISETHFLTKLIIMDTQYNEEAIRWHLANNFIPAYPEKAADKVVSIYLAVQAGKMQLTDRVPINALHTNYKYTIAELFEDLRLD